MNFKFIKSGFTLAEVLITLGCIGIVAAMTIPTLIENQRNKELEVKFKKTYSALNQMSKLFMEENEEPIPIAIGRGSTNMKNVLLTYVKGLTVVNSSIWNSVEDDGSPSKYVYERYKNFKGVNVKQICDTSGVLTDINGVLYAWNDK